MASKVARSKSTGRRRGQPGSAPAGLDAEGRGHGLVESVYETLLGEIMSLRIEPAGRINIDDVARDFGVSQTPIREALRRLEAEALVEKTPYVGYRASPLLNRRQFKELYDLRLLLEPFLAAEAAALMDETEIEKLESLSLSMEVTATGTPRIAMSRFARYDEAFHATIAQGAGNRLIEGILSRQHIHLHLFRLMLHGRVITEAVDEHAVLVEAIRSRSRDRAAEAMRRHLTRSRDRLEVIYDTDD